MKRLHWVRGIALSLTLTSLGLLVWVEDFPFALRIISVIVLLISLIMWLRFERRNLQDVHETVLIRLISHYRHDWMNELQVLFGYVRLRKYDKLDFFVDKIRNKTLQDSYISKLGIPSLIAFLLMFRLKEMVFELELDLEQGLNLAELPISSEKLSGLVCHTILLFHTHATPPLEEANELSLQFVHEEEGLLVDLVYRGCCEINKLQKAMELLIKSYPAGFVAIEQSYNEDGAEMTLRLPYSKPYRK